MDDEGDERERDRWLELSLASSRPEEPFLDFLPRDPGPKGSGVEQERILRDSETTVGSVSPHQLARRILTNKITRRQGAILFPFSPSTPRTCTR